MIDVFLWITARVCSTSYFWAAESVGLFRSDWKSKTLLPVALNPTMLRATGLWLPDSSTAGLKRVHMKRRHLP